MGEVPGHNAPPPEPPDVESFNAAILNATGQPKAPVVAGVKVVRVTIEGTAELAWPVPPGGATDYRLESRRLTIDSKGLPVQHWIAVPDVRFTQTPDRVTALITGIPPGISVTLRILALNAGGEPYAVSFPIHLNVPAPQPGLTPRSYLLGGFGLLLIIALGIKWLKTQRTTQRV